MEYRTRELGHKVGHLVGVWHVSIYRWRFPELGPVDAFSIKDATVLSTPRGIARTREGW